MNDHISKPIDENELFRVLAKWLSPDKCQKPKSSTMTNESETNNPFHELTGIDTDKGLKIARNKPEFYLKLLTMFRDSQHSFHESFLKEQLGDDPNGAARAAHSLKGTAANIGATTLSYTAKELETACDEQNSDDEIARILKKVSDELDLVIAGIDKCLNH